MTFHCTKAKSVESEKLLGDELTYQGDIFMHRFFRVAASLLTIFMAASAHAQTTNYPFNIHVGGGIGAPLSSTAKFVGISGTFQFGAGPNLSKHTSIVGEFMWQGLPPNQNALGPILNPLIASGSPNNITASANLYALTANYMYHVDGRRYGVYVIGGGGWYYRHLALNNVTVAPGTICQPVWNWWGYDCQNGFVSTQTTLATRGVSSGGVNAGGGITINLGQQGTKFYLEARYHYSPQGGRVSTQIVPVTFGLRW
jgi:hypothetical protein